MGNQKKNMKLLLVLVALLCAYSVYAKHLAFFADCGSHGRDKTWQSYCTNRIHYNTMKPYMSVDSKGHYKVKKDGFYRIHAWAIQHTNKGSRYVRLLVNGQVTFVNRLDGISWHTNRVNQLMKLQKGDTFEVDYMTTGSNLYNYHNYGHSKVYVQYEGGFVPMMSGGCTNPKKNNKNYCWDGEESNTMQDYVSVKKSNGVFTVKKEGYYRVNFWANVHGSQHLRFYASGYPNSLTHGSNRAKWRDQRWNYLYFFKKGATFYFRTSAKKKYGKWDADVGKARSRLQISYEGTEKKIYSGYCNHHGPKGWQKYCLNKDLQNTMGEEYIHVSTAGDVKILQDGVYKIRLQVIQHSSGVKHTYMRIMKNGKAFDYDYFYDSGWRDGISYAVIPMKTGDEFYMYPYSPNSHSFHAGPHYGHFEITYEEPANLYTFESKGLKRHKGEHSKLMKLLDQMDKKLDAELASAVSKDVKNGRVRVKMIQAAVDAKKEQQDEDARLDEMRARIRSEKELLANIKQLVTGKE